MYVSMGLIPNEHGVWIVRRKVPKRLQEAVARVLNNGKDRQTFLQRTTGTKNKKEATRLAPAILVEFGKILDEAEALLVERPLRTSLSQAEIDRIAEFHYSSVLADDEEFTTEGAEADEDLARSVAAQLTEAGIDPTDVMRIPVPFDTQRPAYGLTDRQVTKRVAELAWYLPIMREALSRGDIGKISEMTTELLERFHLNLDPNSPAYRKLGMAVLRADVRAHEALERRYRGEPIDTPSMAHLEPSVERPSTGGTLRAAFAGWKKQRERSGGTVAEYERAIELFVQLHGDLPVATITRDHARTFREALQDIPWPRPGELAKATLPELVEWRRTHPDGPRITGRSVNKQFGGVQAIINWARENGMISDHLWSDPFSKMRVEEDDPEGGPFDPDELRTLFASRVFTAGECPKAGQGDVAFWLPVLALFTGARRGELTMLQAADVSKDDTTGQWVVAIYSDRDTGKKLKTKGSARTIPLHPELVRLGFLDFVEATGCDTWLFPAVSTEEGVKAWTKWFGRFLDKLGITDKRKGLHSLRHNLIDALRAGGVQEDLNDALTGHSEKTVGRGYGARARHPTQRHKTIIDRFGMPKMIEAIGKVRYPSVDLQAVRWRTTDKKINDSKEQC
jgi:integrase